MFSNQNTFHGCSGKRQYPTKAAASQAARALRKRAGGAPTASYHCEMCGAWHFGRDRRQAKRLPK